MAKKRTQKKSAKNTASSELKDNSQHKMTLNEFYKSKRFALRSPDVSYKRACYVLDKYRDQLLKMKNVTGVDVGMKLQGSASMREFSIWVYVEKKISDSESDTLDPKDRIPEFLEDVPTDVQCTQFVEATAEGTFGGTQIRPKNGDNPGTLGFDVVSRNDKEGKDDSLIRYLTCAHVASQNESVTSETEMIDTSTGKSLGTVHPNRGVDWEFCELLDCALIKPNEPSQSRVGIPDANNPTRIRSAYPSDVASEAPVWKLGAESGRTTGIVVNHNSNDFPILRSDGTIIRVREHIIVKSRMQNGRIAEPFAIGGDSGAILCIDDDAIGIIRAVDKTNHLVAAAPLDAASAYLNFRI